MHTAHIYDIMIIRAGGGGGGGGGLIVCLLHMGIHCKLPSSPIIKEVKK